MQVSQVNDHVTHAVIGGKQTIEFGISSEAEFFNILSSTLYSDQLLAVVRETLCNANDAHIEAGIDKPIKVTVTDDKFIIQDFGMGIHADDMGVVYGVYGNSTKKNDGKQTGGFGLGCKAPFAYTDHFEVVSCNAGVKTIYNISKSSGETMGKPGITPIVTFPTTETGLTVSIPIKNGRDRDRMVDLVKSIAYNGDMKVELNEKLLNTIEFDSKKSNYMVVEAPSTFTGVSEIYVRYGHVVYPVMRDDKLPLFSRITNHLSKLGRWNGYRILFQAPPHSIAVTPSRETLSMQSNTINTLNKLFEEYVKMLDAQFVPECAVIAKKYVDKAIAEANLPELIRDNPALPVSLKSETRTGKMTSVNSLAEVFMINNYPQNHIFHLKDVQYRAEQLYRSGFVDRGLAQTFIRAIKKDDYKGSEYNWLGRNVVAPMVEKLKTKGMDIGNLFVCDERNTGLHYSWRNNGNGPLTPWYMSRPKSIISSFLFLRNIVVIVKTTRNIHERAKQHPTFQEWGTDYGYLVYRTGLKKKDHEDARAFFQASGMNVVDMIDRQEWEPEPYRKPSIAGTVRTPPKKGVTKLSVVAGSTPTEYIDKRRINHSDDASTLTENPEFIFNVSLSRESVYSVLDNWGTHSSSIIVELFGSVGAITNKTTIYDKWIAKGVKPATKYIMEKVIAYVENNPRILNYWQYHWNRVADNIEYGLKHALRNVYENKALREFFGINYQLTSEDEKYLHLLKELNSSYNKPKELTELNDKLKAIPINPIWRTIEDKFKNTPLLDTIDLEQIVSLLQQHKDPTNPLNIKLNSILNTVFN